jgi:hypothetical protein
VVETVGVGAMPLAETEPTARVATSKASKTWRDNAKTEGHYKRKKREENVVIAFRKRFGTRWTRPCERPRSLG